MSLERKILSGITSAANAEREALTPPSLPERRRPVMGAAAFHGIAGEIAGLIDQTSEADPAASLVQLLVCVGNAVGNSVCWRVGDEVHKLNLFAAIVGQTSLGRKGTGLNPVKRLVAEADVTWGSRIVSGLSSGEGMIHFVRDPSEACDPKTKQPIDPGVSDKRMMFIEGELSSVLGASARQGNTLSAVLRNAWDGSTLRITTKNTPATATNPNVAGIGHITPTELLASLTDVDTRNGLGNRFLWVYSESHKLLPQGGRIRLEDRERIVKGLTDTIESFKNSVSTEMGMTPEAWAYYGTNATIADTLYQRLNAPRRGLAEFLCSRAAPQVRRIACIYALLDGTDSVDVPHLKAAEAVWAYCEDTVNFIFAGALGDAVAEEILIMLRDNEMSRSEINDEFKRHKTRKQIQQALNLLRKSGLADVRMEPTDGRPKEIWFLVEKEQKAC